MLGNELLKLAIQMGKDVRALRESMFGTTASTQSDPIADLEQAMDTPSTSNDNSTV